MRKVLFALSQLAVGLAVGFSFGPRAQAESELTLNPLRFANRAQCAIDSEKPTRSVFLSIDTYNSGRLGFNFGKKMKSDPTAMAQVFAGEFQKRLLKSVLINLPQPSSCYVVSQFSDLQAPLHAPTVDADLLNSIAKTALNYKNLLTPCSEFIPTGSEKNLLLQIDVLIDEDQWSRHGFDVWKDLKLKLSTQWRQDTGGVRFESLLKSVDLESSVMMFSQNCLSVSAPQCDQQALAINSVRDFAKPKDTPSDLEAALPKIPSELVVKRGSRGVSDDFLQTQSGKSTDEWLENFKSQKTDQTWIFRNKLLNSSQFLHLLTIYKTPEEFADGLKSYIPKMKDPQVRDQMNSLCLEWRLAADTKLNFLARRIHNVMTSSTTLDKFSVPYGVKLTKGAEFFEKAQPAFEYVCEEIEKEEFQKDSRSLKWSYVSPWAQDILQGYNFEFDKSDTSVPQNISTVPFLALPEADVTVCGTALDCGQKLLKSMVDLYLVSEYYGAFWTEGQIKSPSLFNPYDELNACKIYDPWFVKQRTQKIFAADLTSTAIFGWNIIPLYVDLGFTFPQVTSLKTIMDQGVVKYDPQIKESEVRGAVLADFGPLVGAPCAVQLSESGKPFNFYAFAGISINYCNESVKRNAVVSGADDVSVTSDGKSPEFCGGCTLSFTSVASGYSVTQWPVHFNPIKFSLYLFRSLYRFHQGMSDKFNIPRSTNIDVADLVKLYKENQMKVPETCVDQLRDTGKCYPYRESFKDKGG